MLWKWLHLLPRKFVKAAVSIVDRVVDLLVSLLAAPLVRLFLWLFNLLAQVVDVGKGFSRVYQEIQEMAGKVSRALDTAMEEVASFAKNVMGRLRTLVPC
ncbi:hypothetical protein L1987_27969 [Smallanthus sonchifolius]|uniref:Uncharacterized protein n=1 Tax=Smallanthus sonchifolius TaxID=185202 RepID=A0ACB9IC49_9ASTR|nr:hypothetical protein L1987_27969 [Smallanthus sonchifolius]